MNLTDGTTHVAIGMPLEDEYFCGITDSEGQRALEIQMAPSGFLTYNQIDSKLAIDKAAKDGDRVVFPEANQLLIDIDSQEAEEKFSAQFLKFKELIDEYAEVVYCAPSKSGKEGHRHIIVSLSYPVENEKRIMYQLMLASDLRRELLSYVRESESDPHPTLFIEKTVPTLPEPVPETLDMLDEASIPI